MFYGPLAIVRRDQILKEMSWEILGFVWVEDEHEGVKNVGFERK